MARAIPGSRRGDFIHCRVLKVPGINYDGGYAEHMIAPIAGLASIPDERPVQPLAA